MRPVVIVLLPRLPIFFPGTLKTLQAFLSFLAVPPCVVIVCFGDSENLFQTIDHYSATVRKLDKHEGNLQGSEP